MQCCLAEAKKRHIKSFLSKSACTGIHPDAKGKMHRIRYVAVAPDLTEQRGLIGQTNSLLASETPGARTIVAANNQNGKSKCVEQLLHKIKSAIEFYDPDAAADEMSAGRHMRDILTEYPNLLYVFKDPVHACRRTMTRTYKNVPFLQDVYHMFLRKRNSCAKLIQHSECFQQVFTEMVAKLRDNPIADSTNLVPTLKACMHRIEVDATPIGRSCLLFHAVIMAQIHIAITRKGSVPGKAASEFLRWLTTEKALQMGMLADASDDVLHFIRMRDTEASDPATISAELNRFRGTLDKMYIDGECLEHGYTKHMLDVLSVPILIPSVATGEPPKVIGCDGGIAPDIIEACLGNSICTKD